MRGPPSQNRILADLPEDFSPDEYIVKLALKRIKIPRIACMCERVGLDDEFHFGPHSFEDAVRPDKLGHPVSSIVIIRGLSDQIGLSRDRDRVFRSFGGYKTQSVISIIHPRSITPRISRSSSRRFGCSSKPAACRARTKPAIAARVSRFRVLPLRGGVPCVGPGPGEAGRSCGTARADGTPSVCHRSR